MKKQIDQMVYKLYDLTQDEIKIVENEVEKENEPYWKIFSKQHKGFEARKELFEKISDELYAIFYENKKVDFDIDLLFEEWINQLGFFGESIKSLRTIFYVIENEDKFLSYHLKAVKVTLILHSERWLNRFWRTYTKWGFDFTQSAKYLVLKA